MTKIEEIIVSNDKILATRSFSEKKLYAERDYVYSYEAVKLTMEEVGEDLYMILDQFLQAGNGIGGIAKTYDLTPTEVRKILTYVINVYYAKCDLIKVEPHSKELPPEIKEYIEKVASDNPRKDYVTDICRHLRRHDISTMEEFRLLDNNEVCMWTTVPKEVMKDIIRAAHEAAKDFMKERFFKLYPELDGKCKSFEFVYYKPICHSLRVASIISDILYTEVLLYDVNGKHYWIHHAELIPTIDEERRDDSDRSGTGEKTKD